MARDEGEMNETCPTCHEPELLLWFAAGSLGAEESSRVRLSLKQCGICRQAAEENKHLARAVRLAARPGEERAPAELVALASTTPEQIAGAGLSGADAAIVELLRKVDGVADADNEIGWGASLRRGWVSLFDRESLRWLRSPAVAYLLLLVAAYPAYLGVTGGGYSGGPSVLDAPMSVDTGARAGGEAVVSIGEGGASVLTVFVPIDDRFRYRLEILDPSGRTRFVDDDAHSFDGVGTLAIFMPEGFLGSGAYEVRVTELARESGGANEAQVFRFPFRLQ